MVQHSSRDTRAHEAWGFRPPSANAAQQDYDDVLLSQDLQAALLDTVGLNGIGLGAICKSWAAVVAHRRATWPVLKLEHRRIMGGAGSDPGQFEYPMDIAALPADAVCVADSGNDRLKIYSSQSLEQDDPPRILGSNGKEPGQFEHPMGVACDGTSIYVTDTLNHRVQKLRLADGAHLATIGGGGPGESGEGAGVGQFNTPTAVCVMNGALHVCDCHNHRIVVLTTDLAWSYTFGDAGSGDRELDAPGGVAAHGGELYIVDVGNKRVQAQRTCRLPCHTPCLRHPAVVTSATGVRARPPRADALRAGLSVRLWRRLRLGATLWRRDERARPHRRVRDEQAAGAHAARRGGASAGSW